MGGRGAGRFLCFPVVAAVESSAALMEHNPRPSSALDYVEFFFKILSTSPSGSAGLSQAGLSEGFFNFLHLYPLPTRALQ